MKHCVICKEKYEDEMESCPFCGCPWQKYTLKKEGFSQDFCKRYTLLMVRKKLGQENKWLCWDNDAQEKVFVHPLPEGDDEIFAVEHLKEVEKVGNLPTLPKIIEIHPGHNLEKGYYIIQAYEGITLAELLERENPLNMETATPVIKDILDINANWEKMGLEFNSIQPDDICVTDMGIRLESLYNDEIHEIGLNPACRLIFRMLNGNWPTSHREIQQVKEWTAAFQKTGKTNWKQVSNAPLGRKIRKHFRI